jgi:phenylalanyl-tRNA synthetase beta chain
VKVPLEWLKEFIRADVEAEDLAQKLTMRGLEVEALEDYRPGFKGVMVGCIVRVESHPKAPNLSVCDVDTGKGVHRVVCGAPNVAQGKKVALAGVGAVLPGGFTVEHKTIREVASAGMLCSEQELGLSDDHSGILILPEEWHTGDLLEAHPSISDTILDINVPPNRGDLLSIFGIAREAGSVFNEKVRLPGFKAAESVAGQVAEYMALEVVDRDACPRYVLKMVRGIGIVPSPLWMRNRIMKCGMRPINAIVDVTNYVMLELGQPLHAFDYSLLRGGRIVVRVADGRMTFGTLDGTERRLLAGDLLICDGEGPVALAGIMGGENSEIRDGTTDVALESAFFNPFLIRKTARRLGIKSEASLRFEKGIDMNNTGLAAERAIGLMADLTGGTVVGGKREVSEPKIRKTIYVNFGRINDVLGISVAPSIVTKALRSVEIDVVNRDERGALVAVPHFRHDLDEPADIVEEIARIYGYEYIPAAMPAISLEAQKRDANDIFAQKGRDYFRAAGFFEAKNFAFFSGKDLDGFLIPEGDLRRTYVKIVNPISKEYEFMRTFLAPGLMRNIAYNVNRGEKNLRFVEFGKTFFESEDGLPYEQTTICCAITGKEREYFWRDSPGEYDFFDIKGVVEGLLELIRLDFTVERSREPFLKASSGGDLVIEGEKIGWLGEISGEVTDFYGIDQKVYCLEVRSDILLKRGNLRSTYQGASRFPQVTRDFSFSIDESIPVARLMKMIREVSPLVTSVGIFDVFRKDDIRSVSFRVVFQSYENTLKDEAVNQLQDIIIGRLTAIDGVTLRI